MSTDGPDDLSSTPRHSSVPRRDACLRDEATALPKAPAPLIEWPIRRYRLAGQAEALQDLIVEERRVELVLNGTPLLALLALPCDLEDLALGFLAAEGLWCDRQRVPDICFDAASGQIRCHGAFDQDLVEGIHRRWALGTGCGGGGTTRDATWLANCRPVDSTLTIRVAQLARLSCEFNARCALYRRTGGVHACGLTDAEHLLFFAEDIGRHNAFDKVAGMALRSDVAIADKVVLTTGRLSAEIVGKAIGLGLPLLASSSAPTALGVRWARHLGLTLVGFLRPGRMNVYTGYQRVLPDNG